MTDLRKAQLVMKDILDYVVKICEENNLEYWLDCGTLLGAVRHGGFIPWDDDIDICMPRKDYEKFTEIFHKYKNDRYKLINEENEKNYTNSFMKIVTNYHYVKEEKINYHKGISIDIFQMDFYEEDKKELLKKIIKYSKKFPITENKLLNFFFYLKKRIYRLKKRGVKKILLEAKNKGEKNWVAYDLSNNYSSIYEYDIVFPLGSVIFENTEYRAPKNVDLYLKEYYGDYLKLPPIEERNGHSIDGYIFDEERLKEIIQNI